MTADDNSASSGFGFGYGPGVARNSLATAVVANPPIRLAILETDKPQPKTQERVGLYRAVFSALFAAAAKTLEPPQDLSSLLSITAHDVVGDLDSYPALEDIDAILITGSKYTAFHDDPWILKLVDFTRRAADAGVKLVGICFGHQIIGRAMGATLGTSDRGWEIAVTDVELTDKGKEVFQLDKMRIHQMHRDVVRSLPEGALHLGFNYICAIQAMYCPGKYITVQGHPEFTEELINEVIYNRHAGGIFTDEMYNDAMKRAPIPHDGLAIARAFLRFMREE